MLAEAEPQADREADAEELNDVDLLPEPDTEVDRLTRGDELPEPVCRTLYEPPPPLLPDAKAVPRPLLLTQADTELLADTLVLPVSKAEREGDLLTEELAVAVGTPSLIDKTTPLPTLLPSLPNWSVRNDEDDTVISLPTDPSQAATVLEAASLTYNLSYPASVETLMGVTTKSVAPAVAPLTVKTQFRKLVY